MAASALSPRAALPIPRTPLIGREREVAAARALLLDEAVPLLTLTGPGGIGKTRFALHVADDVSVAFRDGVAFVALASVTDPGLVAPAVATILGIREADGVPPVDLVCAFLRDRHLLLVLDNFEQVVEAAPFVATLLAGCPRLTVLVTSRTILRVSGEQRFPVAPLILPGPAETSTVQEVSTAEAVRLFVDRARAADPSFTLTTQNTLAIGEICRRLDGLPLAIELASARIPLLTPMAMLTRMERRLPLLTGGPRDVPARLRTMRAAIAWSYDLITPEERALFRRLGVFAGSFAVEAVEAVASDRGDVFEGIAALAANSLLHQEVGSAGGSDTNASWATSRFGMLETVREFALEQLAASGEVDVIRGRHAAWCLALAERAEIATWGGPEQAQWLNRLEAELANLRGALSWLEENGDATATLALAGALGGLWFHRSHRAEGYAWLERALARADDAPTAARAKALRTLATQGTSLGSKHAATFAAQSMAIWTELGDSWRATDAQLILGTVLEYQADHERAAAQLEEAAARFDALGEPVRAAVARLHLGQATLERGDGERARTLLEEVLSLFRQASYQWGVCSALLLLGDVAASRGDTTTAAAHYEEGLGLAGNQEALVGALVRTGRLAAAGGRALVATRLLGAAAALADSLSQQLRPPEQARCQRAVADAHAILGDSGYEAAWAAGQALPAEQAVAEAADLLAAMRAPTAPSTAADNAFGLTPREHQVLVLMCAHLTDREIAERLFLSPRTVEGHVSHILGKLGMRTRREAVIMAVDLALI